MSDVLISDEQRRARLAIRHSLASPAPDPVAAADNVVVLHATDPASIFLSVHARTRGVSVVDIETALFEERELMRTLAMRRTLFVASRRVLPLIEVSSAGGVARTERNTLIKYLAQSDISDPEVWLADAFTEVLEALDGADGKTARQVTDLVPRLSTRITLGSGKFTQEAGATSRVLGLMAVEGLLARGRPSGQWTGRQYVWHRRDQWLPIEQSRPDVDTASAEVVRLWLAAFGPGTMVDLRWWTGWPKAKVVSALASLDVVEVTLEHDQAGFVLADDESEVSIPDPWVSLLPALDPTAMGWKDRHWYVGDHTAELFDRNGNIGPTIWADGKIVGGWASRPDASIATELFEPLSRVHRGLLDQRLDDLANFVEETVVKPSFPTPLQKQLAGS